MSYINGIINNMIDTRINAIRKDHPSISVDLIDENIIDSIENFEIDFFVAVAFHFGYWCKFVVVAAAAVTVENQILIFRVARKIKNYCNFITHN